jgi:ATP-binding cassette subfamily B protein
MPKWFASEVVQSSAMDCGPAALKSLLEGFGIHASYGRLREACQTGVDGTSIDALEETAVALGLDATQVMTPADHLLIPEGKFLPALAVTVLPNGATHFVVVWSTVGGWVQLMDPGVGRRWVSARRFMSELYTHTQALPAEAWFSWTQSETFRATFERRLRKLGVRGLDLFDAAIAQGSWRTVAALDAAIRMVEALASSGALKRSGKLKALIERLAADPAGIPESYWSVRENPEDAEQILFRAAVLIQVKGRKADAAAPRCAELQAALDAPPSRPGWELLKWVLEDSRTAPAIALGAVIAASAGVLFQAVLFRGLFDLGRDLRIAGQRWWAVGALLAVLGVQWAVEAGLASMLARMGRKLELRLRAAFLRKIPLLGDRYFQSRLTSDMAERGHMLQRLRELPALAAMFLRPVCEVVLTMAAIAWLYPASAWFAASAGVAAIGIPLLAQPGLATRDLRWRSHIAALFRFHLDALLGWTAIRAHGAGRVIRREHESLLGEWARTGLEMQRTTAVVEGVQLVVVLSLAAAMLFRHAASDAGAGSLLLLVYWALRLPALGLEAAAVAWQYPGLRNITLRLLEPLEAAEEGRARGLAADQGVRPTKAGIGISFKNVAVQVAGHVILREIDLEIQTGEHVGIVGPSGAGKSSLVGLFLGWHKPAAGEIQIDGEPIDPGTLRGSTAWVDPQVHLWNRSMLENLRYGAEGGDLETAIDGAQLRGVTARLADGLATPLGEGGALVSGGEGQRVRMGRALMKSNVRLVLLDEPARGLDRARRRALLDRARETARETWNNATLLAVTHDISDTLDLPRVIVIEDGRIAEDGDPRALAADAGSRYRALLDAEDAVRRSLWSSAKWRRMKLAEGRLETETAKEATWAR